jgi:hypothetical protein
MSRDVKVIDRELRRHAAMRSTLVQSRRTLPYLAGPDVDVETARAELDACVADEDEAIDRLLVERAECMVDA